MELWIMEEYRALKAEQTARINTRDNLIYASLVAVAAVGYAALQSTQPALLLAIPPAMVVLGWIYADNDRKIVAIRTYIRTELALRAEAAGAFSWESPGPSSPWRGATTTAVRALLFVGSAATAIATWWYLTPGWPVLTAVAVAESWTLVLLAFVLVRRDR